LDNNPYLSPKLKTQHHGKRQITIQGERQKSPSQEPKRKAGRKKSEENRQEIHQFQLIVGAFFLVQRRS
jgi:hypothetical protein